MYQFAIYCVFNTWSALLHHVDEDMFQDRRSGL